MVKELLKRTADIHWSRNYPVSRNLLLDITLSYFNPTYVLIISISRRPIPFEFQQCKIHWLSDHHKYGQLIPNSVLCLRSKVWIKIFSIAMKGCQRDQEKQKTENCWWHISGDKIGILPLFEFSLEQLQRLIYPLFFWVVFSTILEGVIHIHVDT